MVAIVRPNFHHTMTESIYEKIQNKSANYHYYIGKILPWIGEGTITQAPLPVNNYVSENDARNNIISVKQIAINDVSFITRRIDWTSGTVYDKYNDSYINEIDRNFYVLTEDFSVYKCIDNNSNSPSTVKPTGSDTGYFETVDGYIWKFMYFIPLALRNKFLTGAYMPVIKKVKNQYYSAGTIEDYVINDSGQDYDPEETYGVVVGDGIGGDVDLVIEAGQIVGVIINNAGTGYTTATLNVVKGPSDPGTGASISLVLSSPGDLDSLQADVETLTVDGDISAIEILTSNIGYTSPPAVTITGDGTGATAIAQLDVFGRVVKVVLTNRGSGYHYASVSIASQGIITTTARAIMSPPNGHGFNAPRELLADTLCFYISFENELNQTLIVNNQFRQFGIIKDIEQFDENRLYINNSGSSCYLIQGALAGSSFPEDTNIHTALFAKTLKIVSSENNKLLVNSETGSIPVVGDVFFNADETASFTVTSITEPQINKYSGELVFIDNRLAFTSSDEQTVVFRTFIKF